MTASYVIKSELTEKQIEADVAQYLGWCSIGMPFRLLDIDEQATGADKLSNITIPIYMQFKKSEGLKPWVGGIAKRRANEDKLQSVRRFRQLHGLADDPSAFFGLRAKAKTALNLQHNVLLAHNRPDQSYAIYVAPLNFDKKTYSADLYVEPRLVHNPWHWRMSVMRSEMLHNEWVNRYAFLPFLRSHISIAPHEEVASHDHYYAFSLSGDEVSWHSPAIIDGGPFRLSDFMTARTRQIIATDENLPSPEQALDVCRAFLSQNELDLSIAEDGETPFDRLRAYGRWLASEFGIRQILLCADKKAIAEIRDRHFRRDDTVDQT